MRGARDSNAPSVTRRPVAALSSRRTASPVCRSNADEHNGIAYCMANYVLELGLVQLAGRFSGATLGTAAFLVALHLLEAWHGRPLVSSLKGEPLSGGLVLKHLSAAAPPSSLKEPSLRPSPPKGGSSSTGSSSSADVHPGLWDVGALLRDTRASCGCCFHTFEQCVKELVRLVRAQQTASATDLHAVHDKYARACRHRVAVVAASKRETRRYSFDALLEELHTFDPDPEPIYDPSSPSR